MKLVLLTCTSLFLTSCGSSIHTIKNDFSNQPTTISIKSSSGKSEVEVEPSTTILKTHEIVLDTLHVVACIEHRLMSSRPFNFKLMDMLDSADTQVKLEIRMLDTISLSFE